MKAKWIIFTSVLVSWMAVAVINPLMGPITRSMGLSEIKAGWLISIAAIMAILGSIYLGRKSDTLGRKTLLLFGMIGFTITMLLFAGMVQIGLSEWTYIGMGMIFLLMLLIRLIQGLFFGAIPPTGQAYMADITTGKERLAAMALIGSANGLGFVLGPIIGTVTAGFHFATPFYVMSIMMAGVTIWVWIALTNEKPVHPSDDEKESMENPIPYVKIWLPLACNFLLMMALSIIQVTSGFYLQDILHLTIQEATRYVTILITIAGSSVVFTQLLIVNRLHLAPMTLISVGLPVVFLGFSLLSLTQDLLLFVVSFLIIGVGIGLALPGSMSAASLAVDKTQQGRIAGLITATNSGGAVLAPLLGTSLYRLVPQAPFYMCSILLVIASLLIWTVGKRKWSFAN